MSGGAGLGPIEGRGDQHGATAFVRCLAGGSGSRRGGHLSTDELETAAAEYLEATDDAPKPFS